MSYNYSPIYLTASGIILTITTLVALCKIYSVKNEKVNKTYSKITIWMLNTSIFFMIIEGLIAFATIS